MVLFNKSPINSPTSIKRRKVNSRLINISSIIVVIFTGLLQVSVFFRYYIHSLHQRQQTDLLSPPFVSQGIQSNNINQMTTKEKETIAYAISVTDCKRNSSNVLDGAAILSHSIHLTSQKSASYDYARYAFVDQQDASECIPQLETLGWKTIVKDQLPVQMENILDPSIKKHVNSFGCCGIKEFMKLYAFSLIEYPIAVHIDTDVILLKPMDALFDTILRRNRSALPEHHLMHPHNTIPNLADFYFTRDYLQNSRFTDDPTTFGVQGGFFAVKPNMTMYDELTSRLMNKETYDQRKGWSNKGHTGYWGAAQIQGYLSYVYKHHYPDRAVELNRVSYT
jgi:alpha-N-acetylglucosamine transferase